MQAGMVSSWWCGGRFGCNLLWVFIVEPGAILWWSFGGDGWKIIYDGGGLMVLIREDSLVVVAYGDRYDWNRCGNV